MTVNLIWVIIALFALSEALRNLFRGDFFDFLMELIYVSVLVFAALINFNF